LERRGKGRRGKPAGRYAGLHSGEETVLY